MRPKAALCLVACSAFASPVLADGVVLDQIGDGGTYLHDAVHMITTGYFNHYSTPPVSWGNRATIDDFSLAAPTHITRIEAGVSSLPGTSINWNNLLGWRVEIYSSPQIALNNDLAGDLLHATFTTATSFVIPYTPFNYGANQIGLASFDVSVTLPAGMYWVAVLPVNTTTNGYGVIVSSSVGNQFTPWQVLPGNTVVPINDRGIGFRIFGNPVAACYANCDGSTAAPILNVNDFSCFLNRYAAGDTYANCDGSTTPPVLNVNDFTCFLNAFAAGCP